MISRDSDYGTVYGGKVFFNCFLYNELCKVSYEPEVYLFEDIVKGIDHFIDTTGVKTEKRLTPEEVEEIEKEEKSLPYLALDRLTENIRRIANDMAQLSPPTENIRRIANDMAQLSPPTENIRRIANDMAQLSPPSVEKLLVELKTLKEKGEDL